MGYPRLAYFQRGGVYLRKVYNLRYLESRPFGKDKDVSVPVFVINHAELRVLEAVLHKAEVYVPDLPDSDTWRVKSMLQAVGNYYIEMGRRTLGATYKKRRSNKTGMNDPELLETGEGKND